MYVSFDESGLQGFRHMMKRYKAKEVPFKPSLFLKVFGENAT